MRLSNAHRQPIHRRVLRLRPFAPCWCGEGPIQFVLLVFVFTVGIPQEERYGLSSQPRRAAVSNPANIAEGLRERGRADKARFMNMAEGSVEEVRYYIILATDLQY